MCRFFFGFLGQRNGQNGNDFRLSAGHHQQQPVEWHQNLDERTREGRGERVSAISTYRSSFDGPACILCISFVILLLLWRDARIFGRPCSCSPTMHSRLLASAAASYSSTSSSSSSLLLLSPSSSSLAYRYWTRMARRSIMTASSRDSSSSSTNANANGKRPLRPWPRPHVVSHGDYAAEAFLEEHIGGPLYEHQSRLPSLPVPTIKETLQRFLPTALPLAESDAERQGLLEACDRFEEEAVTLQRRLQERCEESQRHNTSWLQHWWNTWGYLQVREPVVPHVSYFFQLADDGTLPPVVAPRDGGRTLGVMRGATILRAVGEYRKKVCSGSLPCEMIGRKDPKTPLCSVAFKYMFNACRIPARGQDSYKMYDPSLHQHCIVARKGYFFAVDFVDEGGDPLPFHILEERLQRCVNMADELQSSGTIPPRLGLLTTGDRDSWADARSKLLEIGGNSMKLAMERLESGAFLLCLDDNEPLSLQQCGINYWHGDRASGHNRWFDKSMQFVCTENGKVGFIGEHSMMDGMPAVNLCSHVVNTKYSDASSNNGGAKSTKLEDSNGIEHIFGDCMTTIGGSSILQNDISQAGTCIHYWRLTDQ